MHLGSEDSGSCQLRIWGNRSLSGSCSCFSSRYRTNSGEKGYSFCGYKSGALIRGAILDGGRARCDRAHLSSCDRGGSKLS
jgi:hypothetical protein